MTYVGCQPVEIPEEHQAHFALEGVVSGQPLYVGACKETCDECGREIFMVDKQIECYRENLPMSRKVCWMCMAPLLGEGVPVFSLGVARNQGEMN